MSDDLVFVNRLDPSITPPKEKPKLPARLQPGDDDDIRLLSGSRVVLQRGSGWPGTARSCMKGGPRGFEVYVTLDQGSGAWFPLDELLPEETTVASLATDPDWIPS